MENKLGLSGLCFSVLVGLKESIKDRENDSAHGNLIYKVFL